LAISLGRGVRSLEARCSGWRYAIRPSRPGFRVRTHTVISPIAIEFVEPKMARREWPPSLVFGGAWLAGVELKIAEFAGAAALLDEAGEGGQGVG
jgi:hypothetical protein